MSASDVTGICLALAGLIYICRHNWIHRITDLLLAVAGISEMSHWLQMGAMPFGVLLFIPLAITLWTLGETDKKRNDLPTD